MKQVTNVKQPSLLSLSIALAVATSAAYGDEDTSNTSTENVIEEVTVSGLFESIDRVTGSAHRIGEENLELFQYDDINRVLTVIPGVYTRDEDGLGLRPNIGLRGGSSDRSQKVSLMEDGVPIGPAPYSAPAAYFFPLTSRMVGVEVYKGPASVQYGPQTIGGAINFVSAEVPDERSLMADLSGGSDGYRFAHLRAGDTFGDTGLLFEYIHVGSDGFKELDGGGDTGFEKNELMLKLKQDFGDNTLKLRLGYADEVSDETYLGLTAGDFAENPNRRYRASALDRMDWTWYGGRFDWSQSLFGGELTVTGYAQTFERAWLKFNNFNGTDIRGLLLNPDSPFNRVFINILQGGNTDGRSGSTDDIRIGTNDREFIQAGLQATASWQIDGRWQHDIETGVRYHFDQIERLHDEFAYEQTNGQLVLNNQPRAILTNNKAESESLALWVRDEITHGDWSIVPGLRVEFIANRLDNRLAGRANYNDYVIALPGLGLRYQATDELSLIAGVHRGFSPAIPSLTENLEPEESINYELGGRWNGTAGRFELIGFFNDYSNLTAICTLSSGCSGAEINTQINAGEVHTQGFEFGWSRVFALTGSISVPMALSYTYTQSEFQEAFFSSNAQFGDVQVGDELAYIPSDRANASIGLASDQWSVSASITYVAAMRDRAGSGSFTGLEGAEEHTVLDLAGFYKLSENLKLTARIDNVTDEAFIVSRRPFGARPGKPQSFQLGISYKY